MRDFNKIVDINVTDYTEKKNGLTYLSWAMAWKEFCKVYPEATYDIKRNSEGIPMFGNPEVGYMTYTTVTVDGLTHEMWLPVMDFKNKAMLKPTMFDVNKTVMRCLTKNLAMFGLGLNIYTGEDYPVSEEDFRNDVYTKIKKLSQEKQVKILDHYKVKKMEELNISQLQDLNNKI